MMPHVLTIGEESIAVSIAPASTSQAMVARAAPESSLDRPLRGNLPPCQWIVEHLEEVPVRCGDHSAGLIGDTPVCVSHWEFFHLHVVVIEP